MFIKYLNLARPYIKMLIDNHAAYKKFYIFNLINRNYVVVLSKPSAHVYSKTYGIIRIEIVRNESTSATPNIQNKLLYLAYDAKSGRVCYSNLQETIHTLNNSTCRLDDNSALFLLQCCGNLLPDVQLKKRHELANVVWNLIQKKINNLTLMHYHTLLMVYLENSQCINPNQFLKHMTVDPNEDTYRLLLSIVAKDGNYTLVNNILSQMEEKDYALSEEELTAMVQVHSLHGDIKNALNAIEFIKSKDIEPPPKAYGHLAYGYAKINDIKNLTDILKKNSQHVEELMRIVKFLSFSENRSCIPNILEFLTKPKLNESEGIIRNTIVELICENDIASAYAILSHISTVDKTLMINTIDIFLKAMVESKVSDTTIMSFIHKLSQMEHPQEVLVKIAETLLRLFQKNLALSTFGIMKEKSITVKPHYYWPLFQNVWKCESNIFSLMQDMKSLPVEIDFDTLLYYVYPYINTKNPYATLQKLQAEKLNTSTILTSLLAFLVNNNELILAKELYNKLPSNTVHLYIIPPLINVYKRTKDVGSCVSLLSELSLARASVAAHFILDLLYEKCDEITVEDICGLLKTCEKYKIKIGLLDLNVIKSCINFWAFPPMVQKNIMTSLNNLADTKKAQTVIDTFPMHRSLMTINQLECHLIELKAKGLNARSVLRKLFQSYCLSNNLDKAKELKEELNSTEFVWTPGMKSNLFDLYIRRNLLDEATLELEEIQKQFPEFKIDSYKIINFAHKFVERNELDRAIALIENSKNVSYAANANINCTQLLQTATKYKNSENVKKMLNLLLDKGYCQANERTLACLVVVHLLQNDVQSAVNALKECVKLYKVIPAKHEILTSLIELRATQSTKDVQKQLDEIHDLITQIQGKQCANLNLIVALAKCNETEELQCKLQEQHISTDFLIKYVSYLPDEKMIKILLEILKANAVVKRFKAQPLLKYIRGKYCKLEANEAALIEKQIQATQMSMQNGKHYLSR